LSVGVSAMAILQAALMAAAFLCSLVAGLLFVFAVVVMPGLRKLDDGEFIRAVQVIDGVIQRNQPLFLIVWVGSVLAVLAAAVLAVSTLAGAERLLTIGAALLYLVGVQLPTMAINVPLNNRLQKMDVAARSDTARAQARQEFEPRWNRWNVVRAACASLVSLLLIVVLSAP
jgi:uncharacterized membrane protein